MRAEETAATTHLHVVTSNLPLRSVRVGYSWQIDDDGSGRKSICTRPSVRSQLPPSEKGTQPALTNTRTRLIKAQYCPNHQLSLRTRRRKEFEALTSCASSFFFGLALLSPFFLFSSSVSFESTYLAILRPVSHRQTRGYQPKPEINSPNSCECVRRR